MATIYNGGPKTHSLGSFYLRMKGFTKTFGMGPAFFVSICFVLSFWSRVPCSYRMDFKPRIHSDTSPNISGCHGCCFPSSDHFFLKNNIRLDQQGLLSHNQLSLETSHQERFLFLIDLSWNTCIANMISEDGCFCRSCLFLMESCALRMLLLLQIANTWFQNTILDPNMEHQNHQIRHTEFGFIIVKPLWNLTCYINKDKPFPFAATSCLMVQRRSHWLVSDIDWKGRLRLSTRRTILQQIPSLWPLPKWNHLQKKRYYSIDNWRKCVFTKHDI